MQVIYGPTRQPFEFPDGTPPEQIDQHLTQYHNAQQQTQMQQQRSPLARGVAQMFGAFAQAAQPEPFQIPVVPGKTFGMTPETLNNTLGTIQQTQQMNASEKIRQRAEQQRELEQEKQFQQTVKLEDIREKNLIARTERDYRRQLDVLDSEQRAGEAIQGPDGIYWVWKDKMGVPQQKRITEFGQLPQAPKSWLDPKTGIGTIFDPDTSQFNTQQVYTPAETPQRPVNVAPGATVIDPSTGKVIFKADARESAQQRPMTPLQEQQLDGEIWQNLVNMHSRDPKYVEVVKDDTGAPLEDNKGNVVMRPNAAFFNLYQQERAKAREQAIPQGAPVSSGTSTITPGEGGVLNMVFK